MAKKKDLQADPEDRAMPDDGAMARRSLLQRLMGPFKRLRKRKAAAPELEEMAEPAMAAPPPQEDGLADGSEIGADSADLMPAEPPPPRKTGFKHKLARVGRIIGLVLWPPFLRGDFATISRRLLVLGWSLFLIALGGVGGWLAVKGQSLVSLPGSEVTVGVARLTLPPEARLAPDQKAGEQAAKAEPKVERYPSGLLMAPDPDLADITPFGPLPKVSADGRQPWRAYARPYDEPADRPRIAIVLTNMGLHETMTAKAAELLPPAITFAFSPYAPNLATQVEYVRRIGHEVLLQIPLEPFDYPSNDPGPYTLLTTLTEQENQRRLDWLLARAPGYIGFTNAMGAKFTSSPDHMRFVAQQLKQRGLMFVDARTAPRSVGARVMREAGGVYAFGNRWIDQQPSASLIDARLEELERLGRATGLAVGYAQPLPVTLDRLMNWAPALANKSLALAPVSALVNRQTPE